MPLFRSKFQPKKAPARKATTISSLRSRNLDTQQLEREFGIQFDTLTLDLGDNKQFEFKQEDGKWNALGQAVNKTKSPSSQLHILEGENNFLKVQVEVLLNMVS